MPRKKRPAPANGEPPSWPRVLPGAGQNVVHIQSGRRVVTVELPPRWPRGDPRNLLRATTISTELWRRAILARERPAE